MNIGIYTLTGQRDKCIDEILALELRNLGHDVKVRNYIYAAREAVTYEKPDVVIVSMVGGEYKLDFVKKCKEWGIQVIVRRGEAGLGKDEFEAATDDVKSIIMGNWDYGDYVDLELVWGWEFAHIIHTHGHMSAENVFACGAFAFDPYYPQVKRDSSQGKKRILFATGFSTCDCRSDYCELGIAKDSDYHQKIFATHREARDNWIAAIIKLTNQFSDDWEFALKVRPGEMTEEYENMLPACVKIYPQFTPAVEALKEADILIHSGSTMAIEAHLLGIPSFNFCNVNPDPLLSKVSVMIDDYNELEYHLQNLRPGVSNINREVLDQLIYHLYGPIDGKACKRAASFIDEHLKDRTINTSIPDVWPKTTDYHDDKENVHLEKQDGDMSWFCPCCRNQYFAKAQDITRCPYCGMQIQMTNKKTQGVLK